MKKFAALKDDGTIYYIMSTEDPIYVNGKRLGEYTFRHVPPDVPELELLNDYYWNNGWAIRPARPTEYHCWDAATCSWLPDLPGAKEAKKILVNKKREELLRSSPQHLIYKGHIFTNDSRTRFNASEALNLVNAGVPVPDGFVFRTADNINVPFTADDIKNLATLALNYKNSCYQNSWKVKGQIDLLTTVESVKDFDIEQGWPTIFDLS